MTNPLRPKYAPTVTFGTDLSNIASQGPKGDTGTSGRDGAGIISGTVDPTNAIGKDGDYYMNTYSKTLFGPKNGTWPAGFSIVGAKGNTGAVSTTPGPQGVAGKTIISGGVDPTIEGTDGDYYFNTTSRTMFGPKSAGAWPAGFAIVGEKGSKGDTGTAGTSATITVGTVTTGAPGSSAAVTPSGTPTAAVFNFTIPQGPKGDTGAAGAGLTNFVDAKNTAAPNATTPVAQLSASSTEANVDFLLTPKGNGALLAGPMSDGTANGAKRGPYAVDLQLAKTAATQVASGQYAVISGGWTNTASGNYSAIGGGVGHTASGTYTSIAGGSGNSVAGPYGSIGGGQTNSISASASYSVIAGGLGHTMTGLYTVCPGGSYATDRGIQGVHVFSSGRFAKNGDAQSETYLLRAQTANTTATTLSTTGSGAVGTTVMVMPDNSAAFVRGRVLARSSTGVVSTWNFNAALKRGAGVATAALVGSVTSTVLAQDAGASAWALAITADTALGGLKVAVTGDTSTINWVCQVENITTGS